MLTMAVGAALGVSHIALATVRATIHWQPDPTLQGVDRVPPDRPRAMVIAIGRGVNPVHSELRGGDDPRFSSDSVEVHAEDAQFGFIMLAVRSHDALTPTSKLGFRLRLAGGELPPRLRQIDGETVVPWEADSSTLEGLRFAARKLPERIRLCDGRPMISWEAQSPTVDGGLVDLIWTDWTEDQPSHCCAVHFGLLVTCVDLAGNESAPSDTVWVDAPPR